MPGVLWAGIVLRAPLITCPIEAFLYTLSYSNTLSSGLWNRDVRGLELLLEFLGELRIKGHSGGSIVLLGQVSLDGR